MGSGDNLVDDLVSPIRGAQNTIEVNDTYQALITDDILSCDGTFTVTLVASALAAKEITIASTNGTITVVGDVPVEVPNTITTGATETFYLARGMWNHK